jgi:signal transduction histidine kinase
LPDAEASGHALKGKITPDIHIAGDRRLLSQALANLLDNGLRHTPSGTTIALSLAESRGDIMLTVSDDGPGIKEGDRERLFQRFARSEQARSTPGQGLGLALVKAVVVAHGGLVCLEGDVGLHVTIRFPDKGA